MKPTLCIFWLFSACALGSTPWFTGQKELEVSSELLSSDDIDVQTYNTLFSGTEGAWTIDATISFAAYRETYKPVLFGSTEALSEETWMAGIGATREWSKEWSGSFSLNAYDGFSDYRSIWISEYYRQLFGAFSAYQPPEPGGFSVAAGSTWDYLPGSGATSLSVFYANDEIAPGWGFDPSIGSPVPGDDVLETIGATLTTDQAVNGWLKTRLILSARNTTDRETRFGIENAWAATAGPVAFRISGGYSDENPSFDASHIGAILEWNFLPEWSASIGYRAYRDSGEIQSSGFNALAPPVDSSEIFAGILWDRADLAISAGVGFLESDYEPLSEDNEFFGNLYKDRDWLTFRFAATYRF